MDELIHARLQKEWDLRGANLKPELLKTEADYVRTSAAEPDRVLWEGSFHLSPHYYSPTPEGPDSTKHSSLDQPVMYYTGSARTPLALPIVTNLSKVLNGDEATYTVKLGILPLPRVGAETDSVRYYVIIERALESNHTESEITLERFSKEFTVKIGEPIPMRLANEPPEKNAYIVRMENGAVLDFYEDFARLLDEHILLNSSRLKFELGKQALSINSDQLTIPYTIAKTARVKVELLSVVDTIHGVAIVDTVLRPADYLAEQNIAKLIDGPYRYRIQAFDPTSGKLLYSDTREFQKSAPFTVDRGLRIVPHDTLEIGGKKVDLLGELRDVTQRYTTLQVMNDRINSTLVKVNDEKKSLERIVDANKKNSIADIHMRAGVGLSKVAAGDNVFVGIEASKPSIALDVSYGYLYGGTSYLSYTPPQNFSQITQSPQSLGLLLTYIPVKFFDGWFEPQVSVGYYGIWSTPADPNGARSATLVAGDIGFACEPLGEMRGLGFSLTAEGATGLGLASGGVLGANFRAYIRF